MTREQWKERLPLIQAFVAGKEIESRLLEDQWINMENDIEFLDPIISYRIKPQHTLRPWKPEEVPVGCLIRSKTPDSPHNKYVIISLNGNHVSFGIGGWKYMYSLLKDHEHSLDHGKTWLPCGVVE